MKNYQTFQSSGLLVLAVSLCSQTVPVLATEPDFRDVEYARIGASSLKLDIYQPELADRARSPLIIWIHGGAWRSGTKEDPPVTRLVDHGFAIASINYRLSPEAEFPAQIHDVKAAIRFLRAGAGNYRFDPDRFIIGGVSAGGHLAALTGVSNSHPELEGSVGEHRGVSSDVQAIVSFYGASNLESILSQSTAHGLSVRIPALQLFLGGLPEENPELAKLASPITHVDATDPPLWLIHGDADPQMPIEQSRELTEAYKKHSLPVQFDVVSGGKHGGKEFYTADRLAQLAEALKKGTQLSSAKTK